MAHIMKRFEHFPEVLFSVQENPKPCPPLDSKSEILLKGSRVSDQYRPLACDIQYEKDQPIPTRDGIKLYADIFRPVCPGKPVPAILVWTPYGKIDPTTNYSVFHNNADMENRYSCGWNTFEGPEPDYWVCNEYAVVVVDSRGSTNSGGDLFHFGNEESIDICDAIEWIAAQEWCNSKVGMVGNSWLAICQFFAAARKPPGLAAIAPWEGVSDFYRDDICRGGIPTPEFCNGIKFMLRYNNAIEDLAAMLEKYPAVNDYWEKEKRPDFSSIDIPTYIVGSWCSNVHVYGTFRAWNMIASREKWLRVHTTQEWRDQQTPLYRDELRDFFDCYLYGKTNDWKDTPQVRVSLYDPTGTDIVDRKIDAFPVSDTEYRKLYLDCGGQTLSETVPQNAGVVSYSTTENGEVEFRIKFQREVYLCGYCKAYLYVSADKGGDMDLFMYVTKEDSIGVAYRPKVLGVDYCGAEARLRVSRRKIEKNELYDFCHTTDDIQILKENEIVKIETVFWPMGMVWRKGETLVLTVSHNSKRKLEFPAPPVKTINEGIHSIYSGGEHQSYIEIPEIKL